jgi:hypothetical protein
MRTVAAMLILLLVGLIAGCGETPTEESQNIAAILSPDGSRIAFVRSFRYYIKKASVFDPDGWEEDVFAETSVYIIGRSTEELKKLHGFEDDGYRCSRDYCPVNISWEGDLIAYSDWYTIHIMDLDGRERGIVDLSREKYGPGVPFTLSGDAQRLFYIGRHPWEYDRDGLYSVDLDKMSKSYIADLVNVRYYDVYDMIWDSMQNCILMVERAYDGREPVVWQITPDGDWLKPSEGGLIEYRRRRLDGWKSAPPFPELEELTEGISYAEWGVPEPDEFD